jgi:hypothetical protein
MEEGGIMENWRKCILQNFPEFEHHPKAWTLAEAVTHLEALLWQAAQAGDGGTVGRVLKFAVWAEEKGKLEEGLAWASEDVLRRTLSTPQTRAVLAAQLNERTLRVLTRVIKYIANKDVLAEIERVVQGAQDQPRGSAVAG